MQSAVCTLYEGHYHFGVAALANSLFTYGFRGNMFIGYRGELPNWASDSKINNSFNWHGASSLEVTHDFKLHFLPVETSYHLTNYKPEFMLRLFAGPANNMDAIAYFDPDIVVKFRWGFFENWMQNGVAVVHDITDNDMPKTHPIRLEWGKVIIRYNKEINNQVTSYLNGGFCGIAKKNLDFLNVWNFFIEKGIKDYGANPAKLASFDKAYPYCFLDQDAMNITCMCTSASISEMGPSGMDFSPGGWTMSHAVGSPKPWKKKYLISAFYGKPPTFADKFFWINTKVPINLFSSKLQLTKKISISIASFISRFYQRR